MSNGLATHIGNVWRMMSRPDCEDGLGSVDCTKSRSLQTLSNEVVGEMEAKKPYCFGYLRRPQMYAENECYCCEWLEQCDKLSGNYNQ